jgi:hypothetical protein
MAAGQITGRVVEQESVVVFTSNRLGPSPAALELQDLSGRLFPLRRPPAQTLEGEEGSGGLFDLGIEICVPVGVYGEIGDDRRGQVFYPQLFFWSFVCHV